MAHRSFEFVEFIAISYFLFVGLPSVVIFAIVWNHCLNWWRINNHQGNIPLFSSNTLSSVATWTLLWFPSKSSITLNSFLIKYRRCSVVVVRGYALLTIFIVWKKCQQAECRVSHNKALWYSMVWYSIVCSFLLKQSDILILISHLLYQRDSSIPIHTGHSVPCCLFSPLSFQDRTAATWFWKICLWTPFDLCNCSSPLLRSIHWLSVVAHIRFKTLTLAYKAKKHLSLPTLPPIR